MTPWFNTEERLGLLRAAAESWIKTPFVPNAAVKGHGVSCQKLVGSIYLEVGFEGGDFIIPDADMHWGGASKESLITAFMKDRKEFQLVEGPAAPGDTVGFKIGGCIHHCGIVLRSDGRFIHAIRNSGTIFSSLRDATYQTRLQAIWRPVCL